MNNYRDQGSLSVCKLANLERQCRLAVKIPAIRQTTGQSQSASLKAITKPPIVRNSYNGKISLELCSGTWRLIEIHFPMA